VTKIPLFPLPETVLFPGMALPLHIFEERYKQMIRDCMNNDISRIVIVLSKSEMEAGDEEKFSEGDFENFEPTGINSVNEILADSSDEKLLTDLMHANEMFPEETAFIYEIGAYLDIMQISENSDGTFDVLGHGGDRCKVENVDEASNLYLSIEDKPLPIERSDLNIERLRAWDAVELFKRYAETIYPADVQQQIEEAMPSDINLQASFVCANLNVDSGTRQELLEAKSLLDRFTLAQAIMKSELRKIKQKSAQAVKEAVKEESKKDVKKEDSVKAKLDKKDSKEDSKKDSKKNR